MSGQFFVSDGFFYRNVEFSVSVVGGNTSSSYPPVFTQPKAVAALLKEVNFLLNTRSGPTARLGSSGSTCYPNIIGVNCWWDQVSKNSFLPFPSPRSHIWIHFLECKEWFQRGNQDAMCSAPWLRHACTFNTLMFDLFRHWSLWLELNISVGFLFMA